MNALKILCAVFFCSLLVVACGTAGEARKKPQLKFLGVTLSKGVDKQADTAVPREPTTDFTSMDEEAVALLNFENLSGRYIFRWDWYDPVGNLYLSSGDFPFETSRGNYVKAAGVWHSLVLKDDRAATMPGAWNVKIYINNELVETAAFQVSPGRDWLVELPAGVAAKPFPDDWGLIVGIEGYAQLPDVQFAKKDALIMKDYFVRILGVPEENIIMLIDSDATKARMQGYLEKYLPSNVTPETTLYVYFAGHGAPDMESGDPYLVPYDGDTRFLEQTGYRLRKLYQDLDSLSIRRSYVFLDSCFSGTASRAADMLTQGTRPALLNVQDVAISQENIVALSASSKGQTSNAYPEAEHGLFTYYLLRALKGEADMNDDQWISIREVYDFVSRHVQRVSKRLGAEQDPSIMPPPELLKDSSIGRVLQ